MIVWNFKCDLCSQVWTQTPKKNYIFFDLENFCSVIRWIILSNLYTWMTFVFMKNVVIHFRFHNELQNVYVRVYDSWVSTESSSVVVGIREKINQQWICELHQGYQTNYTPILRPCAQRIINCEGKLMYLTKCSSIIGRIWHQYTFSFHDQYRFCCDVKPIIAYVFHDTRHRTIII